LSYYGDNMKILAIFIDMLGADYLHIANPKAPQNEMDNLLDSLGGTFFTSCYTPAPDTPRSTACMWSGLYPKANGCNNRLKYPGRYLCAPNNIWETLDKAGFELNIYLKSTINGIGFLPKPYEEKAYDGTIQDFCNSITIKDDSFTFFYIPDLHYYLDNYGYTQKHLINGTKLCASLLENIFDRYDKDTFDYICIFSDHGFRYEQVKNDYLLDTDRVRTTMFIRKKGEKLVSVDNRLCSNLDLMPTVCEMANLKCPSNLDGVSILSNYHEYVLLEDHEDFSVKLGQTIEHWGVVTEDGIFRLECSGKWDCEHIGNTSLEQWEKIIRVKMDDYDQNRMLWDALHIYDGNKIANNRYSNGEIIRRPLRKLKCVILIKLILIKVKNVLF